MTKMNNTWFIKTLCCLAIGLFLSLPEAKATHIVGGELKYRYLGNERFEVILSIRRDCFLGSDEAEFDDPASIGVYDSNGNLLANLPGIGTSILVNYNADDTLNNIVVSDCGFEGEQVCVHETAYRKVVRLPRRPGGYYLGYNRCCRNASLQNIIQPLETGASFFTRINESIYDQGNDSPAFKEWPAVYICANEQLDFDAGAIDADGDSLVYELHTPFTGGSINRPKPQPQSKLDFTNVEWAPPFSLNNLLGGPDPLRIDPRTGQLTGTPIITGQFLVGITVKEYRNGVLIGETYRDFQYNVRVCSDPPLAQFSNPELSCDGLTVEFENESISADDFHWFFNWPSTDSAFTSTEENPTFTFPDQGFYDVRLIATRGTDACADTSITNIGVFTSEMQPSFALELSSCSEPDDFTLQVTDQSIEPDPSLFINRWEYTLIQGTDTMRSDVQNPSFDIKDGPFSLALTTYSSGGCFRDTLVLTSVTDVLPEVSSTYTISECIDPDDRYQLTFEDTGNYNATVTAIDWEIVNGSDILTLNGDQVLADLIFKADTLLVVTHTVTLDNGCVNQEQFTINPQEEFVSIVFLDEPISICTGDSSRIVANPNPDWEYTWTPQVGLLFDIDETNPLFVGTSPTTYNVTVTDGTCSVERSISIELIDQTEVDIQGISTDCDGGIELTGVGGGDPSLYEWSLDNSFSTILYQGNPLSTTVTENDAVYYVRYTNGECSSDLDSIPASDVLAIADYTLVQEGCPDRDSVTLQFIDNSNNGSPGFVPTSWSWLIGPSAGVQVPYSGENLSITQPKNVELIISISVVYENGCESTTTDTLTPGPYADIDFLADDVISICTDDSTRLNANPNPDFTYQWSPQTDLVFDAGSDLSNPLFVGTANQKYYVTVSDGICEVQDSILVEFGDQADIAIQGTVVGCDNELSLLGIGGANPDFYEWSLSRDFNPIIYTGNPLGATVDDLTTTFYVRYNNGECASAIDSLSADEIVAIARYRYEADGCPSDSTVTVTFIDESENDSPGFDVISREWMIGERGNLTTYLTSSVTLTIPKDSLIVVQLDIIYANGCESTVLDTILPGPFANINFAADVLQVCSGDSIALNSSPNPDFDYTWSPTDDLYFEGGDQSNPLFVGGETSTYQVTISDGLCEIDTSITVEVVDEVEVSIAGSLGVCDSDVELAVSGALGGGEYQWSTDSTFNMIIAVGDTLRTQLPGNLGTYYVRYNSGDCSSDWDSIRLQNKDINIDWIEPFPICPGDVSIYNFFNNDPEQVLTYMWEDDVHIIAGQGSGMPTISVGADETEDFDLIFTVRNQYGCEQTDTVTFTIDKRPELTFDYEVEECGGTTICFSIPDSITYNGFPNWNFGDLGDDDISIDAAPCYTYSDTGTYIVTLNTIAGACGSDTVMQPITVYPQLVVEASSDSTVCEGELGTIRPTSNILGTTFIYCTMSGDTIGSGATLDVTILADTSFVIKGTAPDDCTDMDTVRFTRYTFDPVVEIPELVCIGQDTTIQISSASGRNYAYQWGPEDCIIDGANTATPTISVANAKTLSVTITDLDTGCEDIFEYPVSITTFSIDAEAEPDAEINRGESVDILVIDGESGWTYEWSNGNTEVSQEVMPDSTTTYIVTVTNEDGCFDVDSVTITVIQPQCDENDIFLPNAFSPNGDDVNDRLYVRSNFIESMSLVIYNRWGEEVFSTTDQNVGWDGTFNGENLPPDAYGYALSVVCIADQGTYKKQGNINLLR